jgi:hypothetical protein
MSGVGDVTNGDRRTLLEQRAEAVRTRLERRLDALDERRDRLVELAKNATRAPVSVLLVGTATAVGVLIVAQQLRKRRPGSRQRFGAAFLGVPARKPESFLAKAFKRAALSVVATLVQRISTRGLDRLLPESPAETLPEAPLPRAH